MGGWASAWFSVTHPERVAAYLAIAPAFGFLQGHWHRLTDANRQAWQQTGRIRVRNESRDCDEDLSYDLLQEGDRYPLDQLIRRWTLPLLIYHGLRDESIPYTDSIRFLEQTPAADVELRLLKDGDHRLLAYKDDMAEAMGRFFARCGLAQPSV
jgi:pimeloyl-ACP methyl ester carboxylesterase